MAKDYVEHLTVMIPLADKAVKEAREAMEVLSVEEVLTKLVAVGDLLLKAHTEILAAVRTFRPL